MKRKNAQMQGDIYDMPAGKPVKQKKKGSLLGCIIRRFFLLLFTIIILFTRNFWSRNH